MTGILTAASASVDAELSGNRPTLNGRGCVSDVAQLPAQPVSGASGESAEQADRERYAEWADGLVSAQEVHLSNALRCKLATKLREAEKRGRRLAKRELRPTMESLEKYILNVAPMGHRDHACARCVPGGPVVIAGFSCAVHIAHDLRAERLEREQVRRNAQAAEEP